VRPGSWRVQKPSNLSPILNQIQDESLPTIDFADTLYDTVGSELFRNSLFSEVLEEYPEEDEYLKLQ
jgi:hypothetical protein